MLAEAEEDILAFYAFPRRTGEAALDQPLERFNKEIGGAPTCRHLPDDRSLIRWWACSASSRMTNGSSGALPVARDGALLEQRLIARKPRREEVELTG